MTTRFLHVLGLVLLIVGAACNSGTSAPPGAAPAGAPKAAAVTAGAAGAAPTEAAPAAPEVARIVFVGKEDACDCTRKAIDAGAAALAEALGTPANVPVERYQSDTEGDKVEPFRRQKAFVTLPALYLVDAKGTVLGLLQGELTAEQIALAVTTGRVQ